MVSNKKLIVIVGPTAVGKTKFGVDLAKKYNTHVIGADARQFYQEMNIGTAKPTIAEMEGIPHHFVGHISIHQNYNAGDFEREAFIKVNELFETHDHLIVVGGSGLFVNALCFGLDDIPSVPDSVRTEINALYESKGIEALRDALKHMNKDALVGLEIENPHRLIRALEVLKHTGNTIQSFRNKPKKPRPFAIQFIGLNMDRQKLYDRINQRVDSMIDNGLEQEAERLSPYKDLPALKTVGYQEFYEAERLGETKVWAIDKIKQSSRRYAKRQITWFKKLPNIQWVDPTKPLNNK